MILVSSRRRQGELVKFGVLYRDHRPSLEEIDKMRITSIVNLESGIYDIFHDDEYEKQVEGHDEVELFGRTVKEFHQGLSDFTRPKTLYVVSIVKLIVKLMEDGEVVLVHCLTGKDRTGYVVAAFRMLAEGWSYERAVAELKDKGMHWWYWWWIPSLKRYRNKKLEDFT